MKIRTEREPLADALTWVARAVAKNPHAPVLAGIRLVAEGSTVTASAFDFDTAHSAAVVSDVTGEGECLVSGFFLRDAVAGGRGADVELVLDGDILTVTSGRSVYRLRTMKLGDYPALPAFPAVVGVINPDRLRAALTSVVAGADDGSAIDGIRGVRLEGDERLDLVATDRYRFHATSTSWDGEAPFAATVPSRTIIPAVKVMADTVEIGYQDGLLGLSDGAHRVTMRCFATDYIAWRRVIEQGARSEVDHFTIDGDDLATTVKQIGSMSAEDPLVLAYADGELSVSVDSETGDGCEVLAATGDGPEMRASVNPRYMADILAACQPGPVEVHYAAGSVVTPLVIRDPQQPELHLILMPRRQA